MNNYDLASTSRGHSCNGPSRDLKKQPGCTDERNKENFNLSVELGFSDEEFKDSENETSIFERTSPLRKKLAIDESPLSIRYMKPAACKEEKKVKIRAIRVFMKQLSRNNIFNEQAISGILVQILEKYGKECQKTCRHIYKKVLKDLEKAKDQKTIPNLTNISTALDRFINGIDDIQHEIDDLKKNAKY